MITTQHNIIPLGWAVMSGQKCYAGKMQAKCAQDGRTICLDSVSHAVTEVENNDAVIPSATQETTYNALNKIESLEDAGADYDFVSITAQIRSVGRQNSSMATP